MTVAQNEKSMALVFLIVLSALLLVETVFAAPVPATGLTPGVSSHRNLSNLNRTSVDAQAGNITQLDINALSISQSWQGYYGNISGNIILADANNRSLYEWGNGTSVHGEVFASRTAAVDWDTINCSNTTIVSAEETYLGQNAGDADSVSRTFTGSAHPSFLVGMRNMSGCPSTNVFVNGGAQSNDYHQILLADATDNLVYTTIIDPGKTGFDGQQHDFQLLVAENGRPGNEAPTTYYFFTELS
jgi:hypothetical protein